MSRPVLLDSYWLTSKTGWPVSDFTVEPLIFFPKQYTLSKDKIFTLSHVYVPNFYLKIFKYRLSLQDYIFTIPFCWTLSFLFIFYFSLIFIYHTFIVSSGLCLYEIFKRPRIIQTNLYVIRIYRNFQTINSNRYHVYLR